MDSAGIAVVAAFAIAFGCMTIMTVAKLLLGRRSPKDQDGQLLAIQEQLARLQQSVDAIALETERISESQRFSTKLLSDRRAQDQTSRAS